MQVLVHFAVLEGIVGGLGGLTKRLAELSEMYGSSASVTWHAGFLPLFFADGGGPSSSGSSTWHSGSMVVTGSSAAAGSSANILLLALIVLVDRAGDGEGAGVGIAGKDGEEEETTDEGGAVSGQG